MCALCVPFRILMCVLCVPSMQMRGMPACWDAVYHLIHVTHMRMRAKKTNLRRESSHWDIYPSGGNGPC